MSYVDRLKILLSRIHSDDYKIIIVEGYDGVGKGALIENLRYFLGGSKVYRPDYNFWTKHQLPKSHRWAINAAYLDILKQTGEEPRSVILFDRGMLSGMVYNDVGLSEDYKSLLGDLKILHIIVRCDRSSFYKFKEVRGIDDGSDYNACECCTELYIKLASEMKIDYTIFDNEYDESLGILSSRTCQGCGHYDRGKCVNPDVSYNEVSPYKERCEFSTRKEVQDE